MGTSSQRGDRLCTPWSLSTSRASPDSRVGCSRCLLRIELSGPLSPGAPLELGMGTGLPPLGAPALSPCPWFLSQPGRVETPAGPHIAVFPGAGERPSPSAPSVVAPGLPSPGPFPVTQAAASLSDGSEGLLASAPRQRVPASQGGLGHRWLRGGPWFGGTAGLGSRFFTSLSAGGPPSKKNQEVKI